MGYGHGVAMIARGVRRAAAVGLAVGAVIGLVACARAGSPGGAVMIAAAGDIACDPGSGSWNGGAGSSSSCHELATSELLLALHPDRVLTLGDNQYEDGALAKYRQSFDPSWGRLKSITEPSVGNHEYGTSGAAGYFGYFGPAAGDPAKGYYSYDLGAWHVVALNSNCGEVGGCGAGSPQEQWLRADLAAHAAECTLAYWHHPRFSSGSTHGSDTGMSAVWQALAEHRAELVLSGHEHNYERFAPQDADGALDPVGGVVQFVVGTGGKSHYRDLGTPLPNSLIRDDTTFGVLKLTLRPSAYDWQFVPDATGSGGSFTDSGSAACH